MKHQYVGDINDYRKYALLRALAADGANRVGVCWMLTPPDGKTDGGKRGYLDKPKQYRHHDPEVFDVLAPTLHDKSLRRVSYIQESGIIRGATFHNNKLLQAMNERAAYMLECQAKYADVDLVFFDPDTGIEKPTTRIGLGDSIQYVFLDEVAVFYGGGKSVLIYQHRRQSQFMDDLISTCHQRLCSIAPTAGIWAFSKDMVAFFLLVHPESPSRLAIAAMDTCERWEPGFIRGEYLGSGAADANN